MIDNNKLSSRVHYIGYLSGDDKSDAYHAATLLVIPSRHEAMSIVALEAGICGTPVLLTDQCGFDQLPLMNGGWVVPATVDGLSKGLTDALLNSESLEVAALNIKPYINDNYVWDVVIQHYTNLYSKLIV
jgi:glycosyltransferase involved in cell wall biosynthesis